MFVAAPGGVDLRGAEERTPAPFEREAFDRDVCDHPAELYVAIALHLAGNIQPGNPDPETTLSQANIRKRLHEADLSVTMRLSITLAQRSERLRILFDCEAHRRTRRAVFDLVPLIPHRKGLRSRRF